MAWQRESPQLELHYSLPLLVQHSYVQVIFGFALLSQTRLRQHCKMKRHPLSLSSRTISLVQRTTSQPICRRCLATQAEKAPSTCYDSDIQAVKPASSVETSLSPSSNSPYDPSLRAYQRIGPDGRVYRLNKVDFNLKKPLAHKIPVAYLQHSTSELLHEQEKSQRSETVPHKKIVGVVVSSGKMQKTVKVRVTNQKWNKRIKKVCSQ